MEDTKPCRSSGRVPSLPPSGEEGLSLLHPEEVQGLGLPLLPLVDPPQAQDVEQDGEHHDQDAEREQVVVVDEGGAQPAGVTLTQRFLLQVPGDDTNITHYTRADVLKVFLWRAKTFSFNNSTVMEAALKQSNVRNAFEKMCPIQKPDTDPSWFTEQCWSVCV